jgi:superfamily II DNA/RNA helicase
MTAEETLLARAELGLVVVGDGPLAALAPVTSFADCGLGAPLLATLTEAGYHNPTAIQAQCLPLVLSGANVIGISETGSGKTLAYGLPLCLHCAAQPESDRGEGPIAVVLVPTRELVQ